MSRIEPWLRQQQGHAGDDQSTVDISNAPRVRDRRMSRFLLKFGGDPELAQAT
jgi:hypothetical protein